MSDQNQPQDPQGNGPNPWVKSLMVWGGVFLALLVVVSVFGNSGQPAGEAIGYGASFTAAADLRVAIVSLGYADGFLRSW